MNAEGMAGGVGVLGVSTDSVKVSTDSVKVSTDSVKVSTDSVKVMDEITKPALSPHAMTVKEAIRVADRWTGGWQETPGGLQEVLSVLVDHIVTTESHLRGVQKALADSQDRIQALSLDLAIKENRT